MEIRREGDTIFIGIEGDISFNNAQEIREDISDNIQESDKTVVVNLSKVDFMDSSGLGAFITLLKKVKGQGGDLILEYPQLGVQRFLEMTRLDGVMEVRKAKEQKTGSWPEAKK